MKKNTIVLLTGLSFMFFMFVMFVACQKPENECGINGVKDKNSQALTSLNQIPLAYKNTNGAIVPISYAQLKNLYFNTGVLKTYDFDLSSAEIIQAIDDDGNIVLGN